MTDYRMVARHVRYWRGAVHKWSTVWPWTGTIASGSYGTAIGYLKTCEQGVNYMKVSNTTGGLYEIALYDSASGGVPVAVSTYFDWTNPASWVPYTAVAWASASYAMNPVAEAALQVEWAAGLSTSGKPVHFRKWFHSVPDEANVPPAADVTSGEITSLTTLFTTLSNNMSALGAPMGRGGRLAALTPTVRSYFGNHQMPRGRRRNFPVGGLVVGSSNGVPTVGPLQLA